MDRAALLLTGLLMLPPNEALEARRTGREINVHIGINTPPPVVAMSPPEVVLIPGTGVYFAPDTGFELFFYSGQWYRRHRHAWYRASTYSGAWVYLPPKRVPGVFVHLPKEYHRYYRGHRRIPYGRLEREWKTAEREHRKREQEHLRQVREQREHAVGHRYYGG